jgi:hypothetical protein
VFLVPSLGKLGWYIYLKTRELIEGGATLL